MLLQPSRWIRRLKRSYATLATLRSKCAMSPWNWQRRELEKLLNKLRRRRRLRQLPLMIQMRHPKLKIKKWLWAASTTTIQPQWSNTLATMPSSLTSRTCLRIQLELQSIARPSFRTLPTSEARLSWTSAVAVAFYLFLQHKPEPRRSMHVKLVEPQRLPEPWLNTMASRMSLRSSKERLRISRRLRSLLSLLMWLLASLLEHFCLMKECWRPI